ncbi:cytochrome P450 27C1-like [Platysternon megacephalum]|uniref:Cytochrome P450 27C1-like n=1 Tax=Platysternon megacephalum TaxID=55544 RepID=A0A4D9EAB8_9SAUR|nr:cytochrome P450 27C1-like [Platysternon megacephalum]
MGRIEWNLPALSSGREGPPAKTRQTSHPGHMVKLPTLGHICSPYKQCHSLSLHPMLPTSPTIRTQLAYPSPTLHSHPSMPSPTPCITLQPHSPRHPMVPPSHNCLPPLHPPNQVCFPLSVICTHTASTTSTGSHSDPYLHSPSHIASPLSTPSAISTELLRYTAHRGDRLQHTKNSCVDGASPLQLGLKLGLLHFQSKHCLHRYFWSTSPASILGMSSLTPVLIAVSC